MTARQTDNRKATLLMVASMAAFAIEDLFLKRAAEEKGVLLAVLSRRSSSPSALTRSSSPICSIALP